MAEYQKDISDPVKPLNAGQDIKDDIEDEDEESEDEESEDDEEEGEDEDYSEVESVGDIHVGGGRTNNLVLLSVLLFGILYALVSLLTRRPDTGGFTGY